MPNSESFPLDQEVVFTCRDEGPLRATVHWERANGLRLPTGSSDVRGRLEIPNIQLDQGGTYMCVASGYPPNTPGATVSVNLKVLKSKFELVNKNLKKLNEKRTEIKGVYITLYQ